ncbi:phosphonate C-P lyase system protein PhnH [Ectopseudomonas chengduensis]|nr:MULTISPECIES: phosphonate C-P lyase system protein PhnH [Pseudomonas]MDH1728845.1 phosphonate C-P lyase system protein PhnH [Pseudomonas chengduensis]NMY16152.1 phosphonate C-P lyase system protein PhnH [Pseudomonas sp. WS 5019]UZT80186.1 phosphonate C-P lyase system protein PhnH [Pseudomonas chengduensis]
MTTPHSSHWLQPAFDDPVLDAQVSFRAALAALAEPGLAQPMARAHTLGDLTPATYGLCLAFLDSDTPLWLAPRFDTPLIRANLAFHCGCPIVAEREIALFALLDESELSDLSDFDNGSERYPDQSCTLLIQLDDLHAGPALRWRGPGIKDVRSVSLPLPASFWQQRQARNAFPRGLDCFFAADGEVIGLPRSTHVLIETEEAA